eukprot:PITA_33165
MSCKDDLAREFEMKDMGLMYYFLGMEVWQKDGELFVSQGKYANEILRKFHMEKCKPMQNPLEDNWRKEDATLVNQLSQVMVQPTNLFWKTSKHVLRYLRGTSQFGLWYRWLEGVKLQGFTNADWARIPSDQKITSGGIFKLGLVVISWCNRKQRLVAVSSVEAEYMAASQSCIKLSENPVFHDKSKHIEIRYHHLIGCVARRIILLQYISTNEQDANILIKALSKCKFNFHRDRIEVADNPFPIEREC